MGYMQYDGTGNMVWIPTEGDPGYVAPAAPAPVPVSQGLSSYDSFNLGADNWIRGTDGNYYKQTGPSYNSDGNLVSAMGMDNTPFTSAQLSSMGATQRTINPEYNVDDGTMTGLMGAAALFGGLGAFSGLGNVFGGAGSSAGTAANAAGSNSMGSISDWFSNLFNGGGVTDIPQYLDPNAAPYSGGYDFTSSNPWDFGPGNFQDGGWGYGPGNINDIGTNLGVTPGSGITASQASQLVNSAKSILGNNTSLLGTALGGLLGGMNGSKQAGNITTTQEPWGPQQAYLLDAWNKAKQASAGTPLQTQANSNYQSVLSGPTKNPYLGTDNPYLTKAIDYANEDVTRAMMPAMNQANRASGSFGNSGVADQFSRAMTDQYGRNANSMRMQDYTNQQNLAQQQVNNTLGFTQNANNFAAQPAQNYAQTVQGNYGGSSSSPYFNNPMAGILGGATIGNKIGSIWG